MSINWGFIGAGGIATTALAPAVHAANNAVLYSVASRDPLRSAALSPVMVHDSYQELIDDAAVDAVYISLANDQHITWAIKAMQAGKDVLCEKPLALNYAQAAQMAEVAAETGSLLVEAVWSLWHPRFKKAMQLVQSGAIGQLLSVDTAFTFTADLTGNYRLDPAMGGGALLDVGLYQIHLLNALSLDVTALQIDQLTRNLSATGVDLTTQFSAHLDGVTVSSVSSFEMENSQLIKLIGSTGEIEFLAGEAFTTWKEPSTLLVNGQIESFDTANAYQLMVEAFSAKVIGDSPWRLPITDSLKCAQALDRIASF